MSDSAASPLCPHCGHALGKTNRGWWWCSRCERRMRLPKTGGETGTGKPAFHLASSTTSAAQDRPIREQIAELEQELEQRLAAWDRIRRIRDFLRLVVPRV